MTIFFCNSHPEQDKVVKVGVSHESLIDQIINRKEVYNTEKKDKSGEYLTYEISKILLFKWHSWLGGL